MELQLGVMCVGKLLNYCDWTGPKSITHVGLLHLKSGQGDRGPLISSILFRAWFGFRGKYLYLLSDIHDKIYIMCDKESFGNPGDLLNGSWISN